MKKYLGEFYVLLGAILWGCISLTVRPLQNFGFSALQITTLRAFFTVIFLAILMLIKDKSLFKIKIKDFHLFVGTGLISFLFFNFCYMSSMRENSVSVACMLLYTAPVFVTIISRFVFKESFNFYKIISLVGTLLGCAMVSFFQAGGNTITVIGLLFGLGSGVGYALYSIFGKLASKKYRPETTTFYTFVVASIFGFPLCKIWETPALISQNYISIVYIVGCAIFCTFLPYVFYTKGLTLIEAGVASIISIAEPVVATLVGFFAYQEKIGVVGIFGIIIVVASLVFLELKGNRVKTIQKE